MKRLLIIMLVAILAISCCACNKNEEPPVDETIVLTPATYTAASYRINEWRVEGTKDYYTILATYSKDFYGVINEDDIMYYTDTYHAFKEVFPESDITIYNVNSSKTGIGAYIKIHTNQLIDLKKVYIVTEGPATYIDGVTTKEQFIAAGHDASEWIKFYTTISTKAPPFNDINALNITDNVAILSGPDARAYCAAGNYDVLVEENKITVKFPYDMFTAMNEQAVKDMLRTNFQVAIEKDGKVTEIYLPEGLEIFSDVDEEYFYVGVQAIGNKALNEYEITHLLNVSSPSMKFALKTE